MEKKRQVERLVQEMKEANLQSLTGSVDELRHPLDGLYISVICNVTLKNYNIALMCCRHFILIILKYSIK